MLQLPWKTRGICLAAPKPDELDLFDQFVKEKLVPGGCNLIVLLVRYRYRFKSHPECVNPRDPLDEASAKHVADTCRSYGIRLVPKMNLMGHQSEKAADTYDGLLRGYPEFDETPHLSEVFYCRSLCPKHPSIKPVIYDLMDEMTDVFSADGLHIGMDEVFDIGKCPRCKDTPTYRLFAEWVTDLYRHNLRRGIQTLMWGDRLLNGLETDYGSWEASGNFTEPAIELLPKDILICDWHYEDMTEYLSVDIFANAGFRILLCPWRYQANAEKFIDYAKNHDRGHIEGVMATTWINSGDLMRYNLNGERGGSTSPATLEALSYTIDWIFGSGENR